MKHIASLSEDLAPLWLGNEMRKSKCEAQLVWTSVLVWLPLRRRQGSSRPPSHQIGGWGDARLDQLHHGSAAVSPGPPPLRSLTTEGT